MIDDGGAAPVDLQPQLDMAMADADLAKHELAQQRQSVIALLVQNRELQRVNDQLQKQLSALTTASSLSESAKRADLRVEPEGGSSDGKGGEHGIVRSLGKKAGQARGVKGKK